MLRVAKKFLSGEKLTHPLWLMTAVLILWIGTVPRLSLAQPEHIPWVRLAVLKVGQQSLADSLRERLVAGEHFYALASRYSLLPTADRGGEVGWMPLSDLGEDFQQALRTLAVGEIPPVIGNPAGGWHICLKLAQGDEAAAQTGKAAQQQADSLERELRSAYQAEDYSAAIKLGKELLNRYRTFQEADHPDVARTLNNLAVFHQETGQFREAEALLQQALSRRRTVFGHAHPAVASTLSDLALVYSQLGRYEKAESAGRQALDIRETALGPEHPLTALALNNLGQVYQAVGRYDAAEPLYQRALAVRQKVHGEKSRQVADQLNNLAALYADQGRYSDAEPLHQRSLKIREELFGPAHPEMANSFNNLAMLYNTQGRYWEALPLAERCREIREKALGEQHPMLATTLSNLALIYQNLGRYAEAEPLYRRAREIRKAAFGPQHPAIANSLQKLGILYQLQGQYETAEPLIERALQISENTLPAGHPRIGTVLDELGELRRLQGRYAEAEPLYKRALEIREQALGPDHPETAFTLNNLALLFNLQGRHQDAEPLYRRALEIRERTFGAAHPDVATTLNNLGALYEDLERFEEAESHYRRAVEILESVLGTDHPLLAAGLNNLGSFYRNRARYQEAEPLYRQALGILEQSAEIANPQAVIVLINLTKLYSDQGRYSEAVPFITRALEQLPELAADPLIEVQTYHRSAVLNYHLGKTEQALAELDKAILSLERMRPQVGGGEDTRASFFERSREIYHRMIRWQLAEGHPEKAFEYVERSRARVLLDQLVLGKIDLRSSIPAEVRQELERREAAIKAQKAEFQQRISILRSRRDLPAEQKRVRLSELQKQLRRAETAFQEIYEEMKNASPLWRDQLTFGGQTVPLFTVQSRLVPREGLLLMYHLGAEESFLFVIPPAPQPIDYLRLEVSPTQAEALQTVPGPLSGERLMQVLDNGTAAKTGLLSRLAKEQRGLEPLGKSAVLPQTRRLEALRQVLIPDTLWRRLEDCEEVVVIPDGALHLLPCEALVISPGSDAGKTRYWLDGGPAIRYASSATVLYNIEQRPPARLVSPTGKARVLSLSDPIFDLAEVRDDSSGADEAGTEKNLLAGRGATLRNQFERSGGVLQRLPGTARETALLRDLYISRGDSARLLVLQGPKATEKNFRQHLSEKRYLHLGTHGLVDEQQWSAFASLAMTPSVEDSAVAENDGFLQLYEIYELRLGECELAVLSACQTNVGRFVEGEGVFALTRGFLTAGARRVIASQWAVNDAATAELIGHFFRQTVTAEAAGETVNYARALREAKLKLRRQPKWADPFFWAPFVLSGKR